MNWWCLKTPFFPHFFLTRGSTFISFQRNLTAWGVAPAGFHQSTMYNRKIFTESSGDICCSGASVPTNDAFTLVAGMIEDKFIIIFINIRAILFYKMRILIDPKTPPLVPCIRLAIPHLQSSCRKLHSRDRIPLRVEISAQSTIFYGIRNHKIILIEAVFQHRRWVGSWNPVGNEFLVNRTKFLEAEPREGRNTLSKMLVVILSNYFPTQS